MSEDKNEEMMIQGLKLGFKKGRNFGKNKTSTKEELQGRLLRTSRDAY